MQVRKSLQNKKSDGANHNKSKLADPLSCITVKPRKAPLAKTHACSQINPGKQNNARKVVTRQQPKVSPLKTNKKQVLNTSPARKSCSKSKTKRNAQKSTKQQQMCLHSHRDYETKCQTVSTKINTERTPNRLKTEDEFKLNLRAQPALKPKRSGKKHKSKNKLTEVQTQRQNTQRSKPFYTIAEESARDHRRKIKIPEINTTGPQRKQSYFDSQILEKLNLDNMQFLRRKKAETKNIYNCDAEAQVDLPPVALSAENEHRQAEFVGKGLESFRKQQELKWRIMYLELSEFRGNKTPQKIDQIIEQSQRNLGEFQARSSELAKSEALRQYVFESPTKIRRVLRQRKKSSEQIKEMLKSFSDEKLLQQLQKLGVGFDEHADGEQKASSSFCMELQKELQSYSQENNLHGREQAPAEIQHIPETDYHRSANVINHVENELLLQFLHELQSNEQIFHAYLLANRNKVLSQESYQMIQCSQADCADLLTKLYEFVCKHGLGQELLDRINAPMGFSTEMSLRWLRNYFNENQESEEEDNDSEQPVLSADLINQFHTYNYSELGEGQYFHNHAVYGCLNDIFDSLRPGGVAGLRPFQKQPPIKHRNLYGIFKRSMLKLNSILEMRIGRTDFEQDQFQAVEIVSKTQHKMEVGFVAQQESNLRKMEENIFQLKYFVSESVFNQILQDQLLLFYNQFM